MSRRWHPREDQRLRQLYAAGAPLKAVARELGRSEDAINARRTALGLAPRRSPVAWSGLADALLREATLAGVPASELARRLHRPVEQVRARRRRLGLQRRRPAPTRATTTTRFARHGHRAEASTSWPWSSAGTPEALLLRARRLDLYRSAQRQRWTSSEDATLRDGYANGLTCDEIGRALTRRTPTAVAARASRLGLATYARRWSPEDDRQLSRLLPLVAVDEVARALGRTPEAIRRRARKLGVTKTVRSDRRRAGSPWTAEDDAFLRLHPHLNPAVLAVRLGRSDHAVVARLRRLGLREGRQRSPHHPSPTNGGLTPGERTLLDRELRARGGRAILVLGHRLDRSGAELRIAADALTASRRRQGSPSVRVDLRSTWWGGHRTIVRS